MLATVEVSLISPVRWTGANCHSRKGHYESFPLQRTTLLHRRRDVGGKKDVEEEPVLGSPELFSQTTPSRPGGSQLRITLCINTSQPWRLLWLNSLFCWCLEEKLAQRRVHGTLKLTKASTCQRKKFLSLLACIHWTDSTHWVCYIYISAAQIQALFTW